MYQKNKTAETSIIIRVKNEANWLKHSLESIFLQNYKNFEVIIVDNFSSDGSIVVAKKFNVKKILKIKSYKPGKALNLGINNSRGKYIVCLSAHCIPKNYKWLNNLIKNQEFLEYAKVFENYYGSSKNKVLENLNKGENVIFDIDWQGTEQIKERKLNYKLITFFILPPSKTELFKRLKNRDMKDKNIVEERMNQFNEDINQWKNYNFVVINDDIERCCKEIIGFIYKKIENPDCSYDKKNILRHIEKLRN